MYAERCQALVFEDKAPPADLLLIGASRTGYGFDDELIDRQLKADKTHRTDKIVLLGNAESDANLALRTYVRDRGAPDVLGIEILLSRTAGGSVAPRYGAALTNRSYALFGADVYSDYLGALRDSGVLGMGDVYLRSHFPSPLHFFFDHLQIGFDNALRSPKDAIKPLDECDPVLLPHWAPVNAVPYTSAAPQPSQRMIDNLNKEIERYIEVDLGSPRAAGEIAVMQDMVDVARRAGVKKVFFYYFPSFGETKNMLDLTRLGELVAGAEMFDLRPVVFNPEKPGLDLQFRDRAHLTKFAAYETTMALLELIKAPAKDPRK